MVLAGFEALKTMDVPDSFAVLRIPSFILEAPTIAIIIISIPVVSLAIANPSLQIFP